MLLSILKRKKERGGPVEGTGERESERQREITGPGFHIRPVMLFGREKHTERNSGILPWHAVQAHGTVTWAL